MFEEILSEIGKQIDIFHPKNRTSIHFAVDVFTQDDEVGPQALYVLQLASDINNQYTFDDSDAVIEWLEYVNQDIDPNGAAMRVLKAAKLRADQVLLDAEKEAVQRELDELPEETRLFKAQAEAHAIKSTSEKRLGLLEKAREQLAAEAEAAVQAEQEAYGKATPEELAKAEELAEAEAEKAG